MDNLPKPIYFTIHDWMVHDLDLKGGAERDVYALLYSLADQSGVAKVRQSYIVERTGYAERAVRNAIQSLMDKGWLLKARQGTRCVNEYGIVEPASIIGRFVSTELTPAKCAGVNHLTPAENAGVDRQNVPVQPAKCAGAYIYYNNIYNNFFIPDEPEEKKEKEDLLEEFFYAFGVYQPMEEVMSFWKFHSQTGWRNGKGQKIINKCDAASFWTISNDSRKQTDMAKQIIRHIYPVLPQEDKVCFIAELENIFRKGNDLVMQVTTEKVCHMIDNNDAVAAAMGSVMGKVCGAGVRLNFNISRIKKDDAYFSPF